MAHIANRLTAREVLTITVPGLHADGAGLYLSVGGGNSRSWFYIYRSGRKRTQIGLGSVRDVTLAEARGRAADLRKRVLDGENPRSWRATATVKTFGQLAEEYIATHERGWSNPKHAAQWKMTLRNYAAPLHNKPVNGITVEDVLAVLRPQWQRAPETASRLRGRIEAILDAAKAKGLRSGENPAAWKGNLKHWLPARTKLPRGHHAALLYKEMPAFMAQLRASEGVAARALNS
jgi:hypothetical protein